MLETYVTEDHTSWVTMFANDTGDTVWMNLKTELGKLSDNVTNPFVTFKYWIKEETLDLHALLEAISWKGAIEGRKAKLASKIKSSKATLDKLN